MTTFTLDSFKDMVNTSANFVEELTDRTDLIDLDNGVMRIYEEHLMKYLEQYGCKDEADLEETLWYNYGIFCEIKK